MNVLFYPHKWHNSFLYKDVGYATKEIFDEFKIIKRLLFFIIFLPKNIENVLVYHISLKNAPIFFLAPIFKFKITIKADLNERRTNDILNSKKIKKRIFKLMIKKSSLIIIETQSEYNAFISKLTFEGGFGDLKNVIWKHNKVITLDEMNRINQNLITTLKENQVVYYLRWSKNNESNFNCGLDIFLRSLISNHDFFQNNKVIIVGDTPAWLENWIKTKFFEVNFEFKGKLLRNDFLDLLCKSQYYVLTSRMESFNLSLIESIICKCKITTTFTGVARDFNLDYLNPESMKYKFQEIDLNIEKYVYNFNKF
ncbi:MAG: hypothetical protein RLZZ585_88 [Bacteroidota bacterium]|jgi:glycosyltransferase involved in cell wall biosynthesis